MTTERRGALCLLILLVPTLALAVWSADPTENNPVCTETHDQLFLRSVADGAGGMYLVWYDSRSGSDKVYAQHLDADGDRLWAADGVSVSTLNSSQTSPAACSDGAGGLFVAWRDEVGEAIDLVAQRLDPDGNLLWTSTGQAVVTAPGVQRNPQVVSDLHDGVLVTWIDERSDAGDIYIRRLAADGAAPCGPPMGWPCAPRPAPSPMSSSRVTPRAGP